MSKYFFIALFHASMRSPMFYKIDVFENSSKFTGNRLYQTLFTPAQIFFWEIFEIFRNTFFSFQFHFFFTVLRRFCFRTDQYLFIFRAILGYIKIHVPQSTRPPKFSTHNKCYRGKNYTCSKNVHGIYLLKYINYFSKMLRGSEYTRVLNISGFWIYQGHEYASGSEYSRVLNKPRWIC